MLLNLFSSVVPPKSNSVNFAECDSAVSSYYWYTIDMHCLDKVVPYVVPEVTLPDNSTILPAQQDILSISSKLSVAARTATNLSNSKSSSLLVVGLICDDNKVVIFDKKRYTTLITMSK